MSFNKYVIKKLWYALFNKFCRLDILVKCPFECFKFQMKFRKIKRYSKTSIFRKRTTLFNFKQDMFRQ